MMSPTISEWILGFILILSSLGVILTRKPVYSCLSFLLTLFTLAVLYLQLSAQFIAVMQILVYAGAILVLFMYVIILFQDAYLQIEKVESKSSTKFLYLTIAAFAIALIYWETQLIGLNIPHQSLPEGYGTVETLGRALYLKFFFPFEAVILLFLVAVIGALYTARKVK